MVSTISKDSINLSYQEYETITEAYSNIVNDLEFIEEYGIPQQVVKTQNWLVKDEKNRIINITRTLEAAKYFCKSNPKWIIVKDKSKN